MVPQAIFELLNIMVQLVLISSQAIFNENALTSFSIFNLFKEEIVYFKEKFLEISLATNFKIVK